MPTHYKRRRFRKVCVGCGNNFIPTGKTQKYCEKCQWLKQHGWRHNLKEYRVLKENVDKEKKKAKKGQMKIVVHIKD